VVGRGVGGTVADRVRTDDVGFACVPGAGDVPVVPGADALGADGPVGLVKGAVDAIATGGRCGTEVHPSTPARSTADERTRRATAREG
jgi:hypothetical protein